MVLIKESTFNSRFLCCFQAFSFLTEEKSTEGNPSHWQKLLCVCQCTLLFRSERPCDTPVSRLNVTLEMSARTCQTRSSRTGSAFLHLHSSGLIWSYWRQWLLPFLLVECSHREWWQTNSKIRWRSFTTEKSISFWMNEETKQIRGEQFCFICSEESCEWINIVVEYNCNYNCIYVLHS